MKNPRFLTLAGLIYRGGPSGKGFFAIKPNTVCDPSKSRWQNLKNH